MIHIILFVALNLEEGKDLKKMLIRLNLRVAAVFSTVRVPPTFGCCHVVIKDVVLVVRNT